MAKTKRHTASNNINATSSRSHSICQLEIAYGPPSFSTRTGPRDSDLDSECETDDDSSDDGFDVEDFDLRHLSKSEKKFTREYCARSGRLHSSKEEALRFAAAEFRLLDIGDYLPPRKRRAQKVSKANVERVFQQVQETLRTFPGCERYPNIKHKANKAKPTVKIAGQRRKRGIRPTAAVDVRFSSADGGRGRTIRWISRPPCGKEYPSRPRRVVAACRPPLRDRIL